MIILYEENDEFDIRLNDDPAEVESIVDTFTDEEISHLVYDSDSYMEGWKDGVIQSFILYEDNEPVSFLDFWISSYEDDLVSTAVGTRADKRGRGYAKAVTQFAIDWACENLQEHGIDSIDWLVKKDNIDSINIAKELGFELLGDSTTDAEWQFYNYEL